MLFEINQETQSHLWHSLICCSSTLFIFSLLTRDYGNFFQKWVTFRPHAIKTLMSPPLMTLGNELHRLKTCSLVGTSEVGIYVLQQSFVFYTDL